MVVRAVRKLINLRGRKGRKVIWRHDLRNEVIKTGYIADVEESLGKHENGRCQRDHEKY